VKDALDMRTLARRRRLPSAVIAVGVAAIFVLIVGYAKAAGHWNGAVAEDVFFELIPQAAVFAHPR
jgi:energy-converting hydrogenase Eha subunit A